MFLEVILSRGDIACEVFVDLLRENGRYKNLVEQLYEGVTGYDECDMATPIKGYMLRNIRNLKRSCDINR